MRHVGSGVVEFQKKDISRISLGVKQAEKNGLRIPHRNMVRAGLYVLRHWLPGKRFSARKRRFEERGRVHPIVTKVNSALASGERKLVKKIASEWEEYQASFGPLIRRLEERYGQRVLAAIFLFAVVVGDEDSDEDSYSSSSS